MRQLGIGLAGAGFMGRTHALAFQTVGRVFDLPLAARLEMLADATSESAETAASRFGFARSTGDWRTMIGDQAVELVDVATPNALHAPIALAALAAGKHVYCEKPLAPTADDAWLMVRAAEHAGVVTAAGFNYLCNPMIGLAREMIASGELGRIWSFRGIFNEDFMRDPRAPWNWRLDPGGAGAIADLGSHIISLARHLLGPIDAVFADVETVVDERAGPAGEPRRVTTDDQARLLLRFARGTRGSIETSWVASGRTMQLGFEITGERGAIVFDQARLNELELYRVEVDRQRNGFRRISAGPEHEPYGAFCPAPGHQLGYNDLKVIEIRNLLSAIAGGPAPLADFREAYEVQRVVDAALSASRERRWVDLA